MPGILDNVDASIDRTMGDTAGTTDDGSFEPGTEVSSGTADTTSTGDSSVPGSGDGSTGTGRPGDNKTGPKPGQQQAQIKEDKSPARPGDLLDRDGKVLARAGGERRIYEKAVKDFAGRVQEQFNAVQTENNQLKQQQQQFQVVQAELQGYKAADTVAQQYGLTPQDRHLAYRIIASLRSNPAETLKFLLTESAANGITIEDVTSGLNVNAIGSLIDNKLKPVLDPIRAQQLQQQQDQQVYAEVQQEYTTFIQTYPDASKQAQIIGGLIEQGNTPERAYYELKMFCQQHGLDWSGDLQAQWQSKISGNTAQRRPMPGGTRSGSRVIEPAQDGYGPEASTRDIVRDAMREAGINLN